MRQNTGTPIIITDKFTNEDWDLIFVLKNTEIEQGVALIKKALQNSQHVSLREIEKICGAMPKDKMSSFVTVLCKTFNDLKENAKPIREALNNGENIILSTEVKTHAVNPEKQKKETKQIQDKTKRDEPESHKPAQETLFDIAKKAAKNTIGLKPETAQRSVTHGTGIAATEEKKHREENPSPKIEPLKTRAAGTRLPEEKVMIGQIVDLLAKAPHTALDLALKTGNPRKILVKILNALKDLGYVYTNISRTEKNKETIARRFYNLKASKIPVGIDKLVKIARITKEKLLASEKHSAEIRNVTKEIIGADQKTIIAVLCSMADNGALVFASDNPGDIQSLAAEENKIAAIEQNKYPELAVKLNFTNAPGGD